MSIINESLLSLASSASRLEAYDRTGHCFQTVDARNFVAGIRRAREEIARLGTDPEGRKLVALVFRSEETPSFLTAAIGAMAEGYTVTPLYPNWSPEMQRLYLEKYRIRLLLLGEGFASRADEWRDVVDRAVRISARETDEEDHPPLGEIFPEHLPASHPCAWIFTSGTSGELAKCTQITIGNLTAAVENIRQLDFLWEGMVVHSPLSTSHIFAFAVVFGFLALRPRRIIFSDVQYISRLSEDRTGKIDALILVPVVVNRMRSIFYERLVERPGGGRVPEELRRLLRIPLVLRRLLSRIIQWSELRLIDRENGRWLGWMGLPVILLVRALFGRLVRRRLGSPRFVVLGGAKPSLRTMAFLEVMGVRCLQGWGMTETTGPLAVCNLRDRGRGTFGTCGDLFPAARAYTEDGELIVEGPQIASGYVAPDGSLTPFHGRLATGDHGELDSRGRLIVSGKTSDRITCENGINYNPVPMEENLRALDTARENRFDDIVMVGDAQPRLGAVFFPRKADGDAQADGAYAAELVRAHNEGRPIDERIGPWTVSGQSLRDAGAMGPSGKLIRRRVEEKFAEIFATTRQ